MTDQVKTIKNETQLRDFASEFTHVLKPGDVVCLYGDLGAGKTTFVRNIVDLLGFEDRVMSPTFTIIRTYTKNPNESYCIHHVDLYRLESDQSIQELGLEDLMHDSSIVFIEWAERLGKLIPNKRYDLFFNVDNNDIRTIKIRKYE